MLSKDFRKLSRGSRLLKLNKYDGLFLSNFSLILGILCLGGCASLASIAAMAVQPTTAVLTIVFSLVTMLLLSHVNPEL